MNYMNKILNKIKTLSNLIIISKIDELLKSSDKIIIKCNKHNIEKEYIASDVISSKYVCKECAIEQQRITQSKTAYSKFIEKSKIKFTNKFEYYDYIKSNYSNNQSNVKLKCIKHGDFECIASSHIQSSVGACPKCVEINKNDKLEKKGSIVIDIDKSNFEYKCNFKFNNKFDYSKVNYIAKNRKVTIICPNHGEFEMTPKAHFISQYGCLKCANEMQSINKRNSEQDVINIMKMIYPMYDYSKVKYINSESKVIVICPKHGKFEIRPKQLTFYKQGCPKCAIKNYSIAEKQILDLIPDALSNDRELIKPKELDILSHEHKLAIEYNGMYWHSYNMNKDKKYHLNKTEAVEEKGFQLFHIFENEWLDSIKQKIWKSMINSKLQKTTRIYARKCEIKEINNNEYNNFIKYNHIQGYSVAKIKIGLYYNDKLISIMSFSQSRFNKKYEYELIRFCNKLNTTVVGGASKLLRYFERKYEPKSIISYANRRWSQGNLYEKLGFKFIKDTEPNYFYFDSSLIMYARSNFQKHMLKDKLDIYDPNLSEINNMMNAGYNIIFDSGNKVYVKEYYEN